MSLFLICQASCSSHIYRIEYKERYSPGTIRAVAAIGEVIDHTPDAEHFMNEGPITPAGKDVVGGKNRFTEDLREVVYRDLKESHVFEKVHKTASQQADVTIDVVVHDIQYNVSNALFWPALLTVMVWPLLGGPTSWRGMSIEMEFLVKDKNGNQINNYRQAFDCSQAIGLYYGKSGCGISQMIRDEVRVFKTSIFRDSHMIYDTTAGGDQQAIVDRQADLRIVAVIGLSGDGNLPEEVLQSLADQVQGVVVSSRRFTLVERRKIKEVLVEQKFQLDDTSSDPAVRIGALLGAQAIVLGRIVKAGNLYSISLQRINVETGAVEISESATCPADEQQLFRTVKKLAKELTYL